MSEPLRAIFYKDASGEWRWQVRAGNERIIADSSEGYNNLEDAKNGLRLLQSGIAEAIFEVKES